VPACNIFSVQHCFASSEVPHRLVANAVGVGGEVDSAVTARARRMLWSHVSHLPSLRLRDTSAVSQRAVESLREALASALRQFLLQVEKAGDEARWDFLPDSPATADRQANEQPSGWGDRPLEDAYRTGSMFWYVAYDHALGVADLLDSGRSLALLSASRPVAEASARGWLLLATNLDPDERIRRMINERLYALHQDWLQAKPIPELDSSWQQTTATRLLDVAEAEYGLRAKRPDGPRAGSIGEPRPSTASILGDMLEHPKSAALYYKNTSAVTHASLHGLVKRLQFDGPEKETYRARVRLREISATEATADIAVSLNALCVMARALLIQTGWPLQRYEKAEADLMAIEQQILAPS
jgi:hypothetical protein